MEGRPDVELCQLVMWKLYIIVDTCFLTTPFLPPQQWLSQLWIQCQMHVTISQCWHMFCNCTFFKITTTIIANTSTMLIFHCYEPFPITIQHFLDRTLLRGLFRLISLSASHLCNSWVWGLCWTWSNSISSSLPTRHISVSGSHSNYLSLALHNHIGL